MNLKQKQNKWLFCFHKTAGENKIERFVKKAMRCVVVVYVYLSTHSSWSDPPTKCGSLFANEFDAIAAACIRGIYVVPLTPTGKGWALTRGKTNYTMYKWFVERRKMHKSYHYTYDGTRGARFVTSLVRLPTLFSFSRNYDVILSLFANVSLWTGNASQSRLVRFDCG